MQAYRLSFTLRSAATFGRGEGIAGLIDAEVQHDVDGCPYLGGRALRGLLVEECANILYALGLQSLEQPWILAAQRLYGAPGSTQAEQAIMHIGDACLPDDLRQVIRRSIQQKELSRREILDSLTDLRRQTAVDPESGSPLDKTLRVMRVIRRGTTFEAPIYFSNPPSVTELALLAACIKALRRGGTGRSRGRGEFERVRFLDPAGQDLLEAKFADFCNTVEAVA